MSEIDVDTLRQLASSRRNQVGDVQNSNSKWECDFCKKIFKFENAFMNHYCKERERFEELKSPFGQAGYEYYCEWMRLHKRKAPNIDTFATSKFYTAFVKFAKRAVQLDLPNPDMFIRLMVDRDISPLLWARDQCYSIYLEFYNSKVDPLDQVKETIETLMDIAEKENVDLSDIFKHLGSRRITDLIRKRAVTPWLLFCSVSFGEFLKGLEPDEWSEMSAVINPAYWSEKLALSKNVVNDIIKISNELGL